MLREEKGITLVALIITIIILVILAAVTIITLQQSKMLEYAVTGTQNYQNAQIFEEGVIKGFENTLSDTLSNITSMQNDYSSKSYWSSSKAANP